MKPFVPTLIKANVSETLARKRNDFSIFTFASKMGQERSSDLSRSLPALFRYKLIKGNGKFNIVQTLKNMPEYIGYT